MGSGRANSAKSVQAAAAEGSLTGITPDGDVLRVREVWQDNLEVEMQVSIKIFSTD
jgi:hypothetical protein